MSSRHRAAPPPPKKTKSNGLGLAPTQTIDSVAEIHEWEPYAIDGIDVPLRRIVGDRRVGVPAIDPTYEFREEYVRELVWAVWPHDGGDWTPSLLVGQRGCGKTSLVTQLAAHCNVRVVRVNCNVGTSVRHLKGRTGASKGSTHHVAGMATGAMEQGDWLLLDEISGMTPPVALALFPILEPDGEVPLEEEDPPRFVRRHKDFRIMLTDNTIGASQEATRFSYAGTQPVVNAAMLDRICSTIEVDYLSSAAEHRVAKVVAPDIDNDDLEGIIRVANNVRSSGAGIAFSTRMVLQWARRVGAGHASVIGSTRDFTDVDILNAAGPAFLNRMRSNVERDAVKEVICRTFGFDLSDMG